MRTKGAENRRVSKELEIRNKLGLHARPAAEFVRAVQAFRSEIVIISEGKRFDGGRLMDVMIANLDCGARFTLEAFGPDAEEAVNRIERVLAEICDAEARGEMN